VNGAVFTNQIVIADFDSASDSFRKTNILRGAANNRAVSDSITTTDDNLAFDNGVRADARILPNRDLTPD